MNIPEQPSPPQEELLERALRYASEQRAYDDDRHDETHEQCAARWYLTARPDPSVSLEDALRALCADTTAASEARNPRLPWEHPRATPAERAEEWYQGCLAIARSGWASQGDRWRVTEQGKRYLLEARWASSPTVAEAEADPQTTRWVTKGPVTYAVRRPGTEQERDW